ncbi:MAG: hypothetical protein JW703_00875 [Candidatus Diapherotrites archaeon]|nr:hypothetical protein [Candidatus Diapherotrites archaeon]
MEWFDFIFSAPEIFAFYLIVSYFFLGALIKFIDDCFDEALASKSVATILSVIVAGLWAFDMTLSAASATILAAIVIGVLVKGKVDNIAFQIGVIGVGTILFFFGFFQFLWFPLIIISLAGVIDEVGNDFVDEKNMYTRGFFGKLVHLFFEYRMLMKIVVFLFAFFGFFELFYFLAFLFWDLGYIVVTKLSEHIRNSRKFSYTGNNHYINGVRK